MLKNIPLIYEIGPEKLPPNQTGSSDLKNGSFKVKAGTMKTPGFITCLCRTEVDGITYSNYVNIGFSPEKLKPTTTLPEDFTKFWERAKAETASIPMEPLITLLPEQCTPETNVYRKEVTSMAFSVYLKSQADTRLFSVYRELE